MNLSKGGGRLALVAVALFSQVLLAQQMPGTGQDLRFDSSGNQQSPSQLPIQSPTIVTPQVTPGADKVFSNSSSPATERQELRREQARERVRALPPQLDTVYVMLRRLVRGASPFSADRRHIHHTLIYIGLSEA